MENDMETGLRKGLGMHRGFISVMENQMFL